MVPRAESGRCAPRRGSLAAFLSIVLLIVAARAAAAQPQRPGVPRRGADSTARVTIARGGRTAFSIAVPAHAPEPVRLAGAELARYLQRLSGAVFAVHSGRPTGPAIVLAVDSTADVSALDADAYVIAARTGRIRLTGGSPRAVLFAAYDLLEKLGCRWLAPELPFYHGAGEVVPRRAELVYLGARRRVERPVLALRKLDVEEGLSHDEASLRSIVAWMPKARLNVLQVPLDYGGTGRVRWDAWREALTPDLRRRGLLLEVGGHGYQNFLNADMQGGRLFQAHPEWFGRDASCRPSRARNLVFNTGDSSAVAFVADGVVSYLRNHPEVDLFDFWPPDGARWSECPDLAVLGPPPERQARLVNRVAAAVRAAGLQARLETIAYGATEQPPELALDSTVLVDFCPIDQDFDVFIDDTTGAQNRRYVGALHAWRRVFPGRIGLYSYYRKYAWRSLPVILPHYLQHELRWYAALPVQGISTFAEPGDWGTYELNHYVLARLAWDPSADVEGVVADFARARYGPAAPAALRALQTLEAQVRLRGSITNSAPDTPPELAEARAELEAQWRALGGVRAALRASRVRSARAHLEDEQVVGRTGAAATAGAEAAALERLRLMLEYARRDVELRQAEAEQAPPARQRELGGHIFDLLLRNAGAGVFLTPRPAERDRFIDRYLGARTARTPSPVLPTEPRP